jgi:preprotein translocase subunit SecG
MFELSQLPLAPLALGFLHWVFIIPICVLSLFLTLLILVQRGRGGGLTGALGGMGGQSAFGAKAGDLFTKITIVTAMIWILLGMGALKALHKPRLSGDSTKPLPATAPGDTTKGGETPVDPTGPAPSGLTPDNTPAPKGDAPKNDTPAPAAPAAPAEPPAAPATPPATPEKSDK